MPLFTDSLLLGEVVRRIKELPLAQKLLIAPLQWLGNSHHHLDMPGTLSADPRVYLDTLRDLAECFLRHGFTRIVFINGHGGNKTPSEQMLFELRQKYRDRSSLLLLSLTYWDAIDPCRTISGLSQTQMGHACEWETSIILRIRPDLVVGPLDKIAEVPFGNGGAPGYRSWTMPDRSQPGHIGNPAAATAEKGESLFRLFAEGVANYLERAVAWENSPWTL